MQNIMANIAYFIQANQWLTYALLVWSLAWKGLALWKAARKNHFYWFLGLLLVNTLGLGEILYIFVFSKMNSPSAPKWPFFGKKDSTEKKIMEMESEIETIESEKK